MTKKVSYHAKVERMERISYIIDYCKGEFGPAIAETYDNNNGKVVLTEKGIVIVYNATTNNLVTMFIATVSQGISIYKNCHNCEKCPKSLMKTLNNNKKACENQPKG